MSHNKRKRLEEEEEEEEMEEDIDDDEYDEETEISEDKMRTGNSSTTTKEIPLFEKLKMLQQQQEEESFANVASSFRKKKITAKNNKSEEENSTKKNKHAPSIMRSDRPVRRLRDNGSSQGFKFRDPRFSAASGTLNEDKFHQSFQFLEGYQESEIDVLKRAMKKAKNSKSEELKEELHRRQQEMTERRRALAVKDKLKAVRAEEMSKVKEGKKPYFLKDSAKKQIALEEKYDELKKSGKLQKYMEKKRKKNSNKDHRWMPETRRQLD